MTPQSGSAQTRKPHSCFLAGLTPRRPTLMTIFGDGVLARERAHADPFEFGHDASSRSPVSLVRLNAAPR